MMVGRASMSKGAGGAIFRQSLLVDLNARRGLSREHLRPRARELDTLDRCVGPKLSR